MDTITSEQAGSHCKQEQSFWPPFFLCLFPGWLGAHRFYAGKFKSGAIQLVTLGGLGFWALFDLIMLLTSKFTSAGGIVYRNPKPKVAWGIAVVVLVIGLASRSGDSGSRPSGGSSSRSTSSPKKDFRPEGLYAGQDKFGFGVTLRLNSNGKFLLESPQFSDGPKVGDWSVNGDRLKMFLSGESVGNGYFTEQGNINMDGTMLRRQ